MKIPKTIKIGGHEISIFEKDEINVGGDIVSGVAYVSKNKIEIESSSPESRKAETLLHEILHFISEFTSIGLKENQINIMAYNLFQVLRDNELDFRRRG